MHRHNDIISLSFPETSDFKFRIFYIKNLFLHAAVE
jgi:hypothetical protein